MAIKQRMCVTPSPEEIIPPEFNSLSCNPPPGVFVA